jgi:PIN domain nuclease of toxin-antitoxin system
VAVSALLLDTHALVWASSTPDRLSPTARTLIADAANPLVVSAASAWELAIKFRSGRFPTAEPLVRQFDAVCARIGATTLPMTSAHALRAGGLGWEHPDPFDRMLVAQALLENLTLITRDGAMRAVTGLSTAW